MQIANILQKNYYMEQTRSFKDLGIKNTQPKSFVGEQIPIKKIIGKEITILDYKTGPSKYSGTRLDMQIVYNKEKRVVWTSSGYLLETIQQIPADAFPTTTIIEIEERFEFS